MRDYVRSFFIWAGIAGLTAMMFPPGMVMAAVAWLCGDRTARFGHWWATLWGKGIIKINPAWSCTVEGQVPAGKHYVIVANHESMGDIMVAFHLDTHFKWFAKAILFQVPFMGWHMTLAGYIPVKRGHSSSVRGAMARARRWLDRGVSVVFFPEGTRSRDGNVQPFKQGAFRLALEAQVDLLPVAITGTRDALPKHSFRFARERCPMRALVGEPIPVAGLDERDLQGLMDHARDEVVALKDRLEGREAPPVRRRAVG
jgi:1-acyl-sn-glycerol-3-phosphate acyltransferase